MGFLLLMHQCVNHFNAAASKDEAHLNHLKYLLVISSFIFFFTYFVLILLNLKLKVQTLHLKYNKAKI